MSLFFESLEYFWQTYIAAVLMSMVLAFLGCMIVTRGQIFFVAAVSQASILGMALGILSGGGFTTVFSIVFAVSGALLAGGGVHGSMRSIRDERTALVFLLTSSLSVILLSKYPAGLRDLQSSVSSTVLGAGPVELALFVVLAIGSIWIYIWKSEEIVLYLTDPVMAAAVGLDILLWSWVISGVTGFVTGLVVNSAGVLFAFGSMVLPALGARNICRETKSLFVIAPILSGVGTSIGLFISVVWEIPSGQSAVFIQSLMLVLTYVVRQVKLPI